MQNSRLSLYFIELNHCERKLEYCREILAENTSFTPLDLYQEIDQETKNSFQASELKEYLHANNFIYSEQEFRSLFQFFNTRGDGRVSAKMFINFLKPNLQKQSHSAHEKDTSITSSAKYAIKKLFDQIVQNEKCLVCLRSDLTAFLPDKTDIYEEIEEETLQKFMKANGKYPGIKEIRNIIRGIETCKNKLSVSKINQFIQGHKPAIRVSISKGSETEERKLQRKESFQSSVESYRFDEKTYDSVQWDHQEAPTYQKLVTFSSMKDLESELEHETEPLQSRYLNLNQEKETPYKLLLTSSKKQNNISTTPKRKDQIYKPTKLAKKGTNYPAAGKQNKIFKDQPVKKEEIMNFVNNKNFGLKDTTCQRENRL